MHDALRTLTPATLLVLVASICSAQPPGDAEAKTGWIGVRTTAVPEAVRAQIGDRLPESGGLLATFVTADSPAATAGITRYDVVVAIDDEPVSKPRAFDELVAGTAVGGTLTVKVIRGGRELSLAVVVAERPPRRGPQGPGIRSLSGRPTGGGGPRIVKMQAARIQRVPKNMNPARQQNRPEGIGLAEGPIGDRAVLLVTEDGQSFDVTVRTTDDSWTWTATSESMDTPEQVPESMRKHVGRLLAGIEAERARGAFRFRVQPRAQGEGRSVALLVQQATEDGAFRVLEVERELEGDKLPVGRLLGVESLQSELELVEPVVRDRLVATLRRYRVPPVRATMRATR